VASLVAAARVVEVSQLYHAPRIDDLPHTRLGALILGGTFAFADIAAYLVGIAVGALAEWVTKGFPAALREFLAETA
jgi:hypothetical protein